MPGRTREILATQKLHDMKKIQISENLMCLATGENNVCHLPDLNDSSPALTLLSWHCKKVLGFKARILQLQEEWSLTVRANNSCSRCLSPDVVKAPWVYDKRYSSSLNEQHLIPRIQVCSSKNLITRVIINHNHYLFSEMNF